MCCAFDVLEHLESFHLMNSELFRVAKNHVLVSLPNSAAEVFYDGFWNRPQRIPDKERGTYTKYYGLPIEAPSDRHRWWLYFQDIIRFYYWFGLTRNCGIEFWVPRRTWKKRLFSAVCGERLMYTYFCPHVWILMTKDEKPDK
jgi:hypothetical protein